MRKARTHAATALACALLMLAGAGRSAAEPEESTDPVLAHVGGTAITASELRRWMGPLDHPSVTEPMRRHSLKQRVRSLLLSREAERFGITIGDQVVADLVQSEMQRRGEPSTEKDGGEALAARTVMTREQLLARLLGWFLCRGAHAFGDVDWHPAIDPAVIERIYREEPSRSVRPPGVRAAMFTLDDAGVPADDPGASTAEVPSERTLAKILKAARDGMAPADVAGRFDLGPGQWRMPREKEYVEQGGPVVNLGTAANAWLFDPTRQVGDAEEFRVQSEGFVILVLGLRPSRTFTLEEARDQIVEDLRNARLGQLTEERLIELVREPGVVTPRDLALEIETDARHTIEGLGLLRQGRPDLSPPLPVEVFDSFDEALSEAFATNAMLYLHVDPVPKDAERAVSAETLTGLATEHVVAVVSGRVGDRAADRLRARYGLMEPGPFSVAIAPNGTLLARDVPFDLDGARKAMAQAHSLAGRAKGGPEPSAPTPASESLVLGIWFEPQAPKVGDPLTIKSRLWLEAGEPLERLRVTGLIQVPGEVPLQFTGGVSSLAAQVEAEVNFTLKPSSGAWFHVLVTVDAGTGPIASARASTLVR